MNKIYHSVYNLKYDAEASIYFITEEHRPLCTSKIRMYHVNLVIAVKYDGLHVYSYLIAMISLEYVATLVFICHCLY